MPDGSQWLLRRAIPGRAACACVARAQVAADVFC